MLLARLRETCASPKHPPSCLAGRSFWQRGPARTMSGAKQPSPAKLRRLWRRAVTAVTAEGR